MHLVLEKHLIRISSKDLINLIQIAFNMRDDRTVLIRNKIIEILLASAQKLSKIDFETICLDLISKWTNHRSFMFRVTAIHAVALLSLIPGFKIFNKLFGDLVKNGIKEKVMNVKLSLMRLVGLLNQSNPKMTKNNHQLNILLRFYQDDMETRVSAVALLVLKSLEEKHQRT